MSHIRSNCQVHRVIKHVEMEDDNLMQADFFGNCFKEYMLIINVKE